MSILGTKPAPVDGLPAGSPRGREAERILAAELLSEFRHFQQSMTEFTERLGGRITNHVLEVGTRTFDSTGVIPRTYGVPAGAIEVTNLSTASASASTTSTPTSAAGGTAPAAGAEFSATVPAGQTWTLQSLDVSLTTSATVANRIVQIVIDDGANVLYKWVSAVTQTAGQTIEYTGANGGIDSGGTARNNVVLFDLPAVTLAAGYRIRSITSGIQAGDQYTSAPRLGYLLTAGTVLPAHTVTVTATVPGSNTPASGTGVYIVPPGTTRVIPLASREVTLYGTSGDTVSYSVFTAAPAPAVI